MIARRGLLLTRPKAQSEAFAKALEAALPGRFAAVVSPLLEIAATDAPLDLANAQGLVFTSANGVMQFAARGLSTDLPAYCVGDMTAGAARQSGLVARSAGGDVAALADMVRRAHRPGSGDFIHVRGRHAAGDLVGSLAQSGVPARGAEIYDQLPLPLRTEALSDLTAGRIEVIALFSPRTARVFAEAVRDVAWDRSRPFAVSLSPAADAPLAALAPLTRRICAAPTRAGMIETLREI